MCLILLHSGASHLFFPLKKKDINNTGITLQVSSATRPFCNVTSSGDTCRSIERNGSKCEDGNWTGNAQIGFSGGSLVSVYLSTSTVNITHQRLDIASPPLDILLRWVNGHIISP